MTTTVRRRPASRTSRRAGYVIAILINGLLLYVATHLLEWDVVPFLTQAYARVLPLVRLSLVATVVVNVAYLWHDGRVFRSATQIVLSGVALAVALALFEVYPFDFSTYADVWDVTARSLLVVGIVGATIGAVIEVVRLVGALADGGVGAAELTTTDVASDGSKRRGGAHGRHG